MRTTLQINSLPTMTTANIILKLCTLYNTKNMMEFNFCNSMNMHENVLNESEIV